MLEQILTDLYDSEINARLHWFWDGGIWVEISDPDEHGAQANVRTFAEAAVWLRDKAIECYPESKFAKKYTAGAQLRP